MTTNNWDANLSCFIGAFIEASKVLKSLNTSPGARITDWTYKADELLESQRQQIIEEIRGLFPVTAESTGGKVYAEVSKQAWEMAIKEVLSLPSLQVNKDL